MRHGSEDTTPFGMGAQGSARDGAPGRRGEDDAEPRTDISGVT